MELSLPEPRNQAVCAAEGGAGEVTQAPWKNPEDREWIQITVRLVIYTVGVWLCLFRS